MQTSAMTTKLSACLALCCAVFGLAAHADVRLNGMFSDHMVLQRGKSVAVWGWAEDGEKVSVTFRGSTVSTVASSGKWMVHLASQKAGGPEVLTVAGKNTIELQDVLVGEVWICSGQSNMEWPLRSSFESTDAINKSANPNIRLYTVPKLKPQSPVDDVKGSWQMCSPETVPGFSAVGYFFGRDLQASLGVPVGLIHTSWGGSPAEAWMRQAVLEADVDFKTKYLDTYPEAQRAFAEDLAKWEKENAEAKAAGKTVGRGRPWSGWRPSELYDGMIAPLIPYGIAGAIWYQGESNASAAYLYRRLFADMIRNWRKDFAQGDFPFLTVQLAPWDKNRKRSFNEITTAPSNSDWPELREAQSIASTAVGHAGVVVITDVGDRDDIHPTKKEPVGHRLSLLARNIAYKQKIEAQGPTFKKVKFKNGKAIVRFTHIAEGLQARTGKVTGFAIAGSDGNFVWANADIIGDTVVVSHPSVKDPAAVRFGWADYPVVDLWNSEWLPASPFRTDNFQMVTAPKK